VTTRAEVVTAARSLLDVPFQHQGRTPAGIDCAGVVVYVSHLFGLSSFDATGYRRLPAGIGKEKIEDVCRREMRQIDSATAKPGDVALFLIGKRPRHLAIIGDRVGLSIIHAYEPTGKVTENAFDLSWRRILFETYALPGIC
jgi:cell wall-associated NlpC family hydrolase